MSNLAMSVILPESQQFKMPDSLKPEDRAFLIRELGKISSELAVKDERIKQLSTRVAKLENVATASGEHRALQLQSQLDKRDADALIWRGRVWSIMALLITSGLVGLITHWLSTR